MKLVRLIPSYLFWHYTQGYGDLWRISGNFFWFFSHFFSIPILLRTLFSPFERIREPYEGGIEIGAFFASLTVNALMRVVGVFVRLACIGIGIMTLTLCAVIAAVGLLVWAFVPFLVVGLFLQGLAGLAAL